MTGVFLILHRVHTALQVFDAHAHGKGLCLHDKSPVIQPLHRVPGTVSQCQHQVFRRQGVRPFRGGNRDSFQLPVFRLYILQPMAKPDVRPQKKELAPQIFQGDVQLVRAHMGLGIGEDALRCAAVHKLPQDPAVAQILCAGVQFPVGKGPCAPLTELHIGVRQQRTALPEVFHIPLPLLHRLPPLQEDGPQPCPG